jgi:hypothetical protein
MAGTTTLTPWKGLFKIGATGNFSTSTPVMSRRVLVGLLAALAVLLVTFSILMGFYLLTSALEDPTSTLVLGWAGRICGGLVVLNLVLLVIALAMHAIGRGD